MLRSKSFVLNKRRSCLGTRLRSSEISAKYVVTPALISSAWGKKGKEMCLRRQRDNAYYACVT